MAGKLWISSFWWYKGKNIFFPSCRACDFLGRSGQIFSFILRSCPLLHQQHLIYLGLRNLRSVGLSCLLCPVGAVLQYLRWLWIVLQKYWIFSPKTDSFKKLGHPKLLLDADLAVHKQLWFCGKDHRPVQRRLWGTSLHWERRALGAGRGAQGDFSTFSSWMGGSQTPAAYLMEGKKIDRKIQGEGYNCRTNKTNGDGEWSNVAVQRRWIERRLVPGAGKGAYFAYKFHSCLSFKKVLKKVLKESWVLKFSETHSFRKKHF